MKKISTSTLQRPMVICLLAAFCCLLWGSAFPAVKIGYGLLSISSADSAEQLIFAGLRFFFAGVVAVLFHSASLRRLRLPARSSLWKATKLGLIQTLVQYALFYIGMAHTSGVKGSVLMAVHVFFAILISAKLFHYERLNAPKLLGCLCGFGGVLLINLSGGGLGGGFTLLGDGAVLLAALANGFSISLFQAVCRGRGHPDPVRISVHRGRGAFAADGTVLRRYAAAFHRAVPSAVGIHGAAVRRGPDHLERPDPV